MSQATAHDGTSVGRVGTTNPSTWSAGTTGTAGAPLLLRICNGAPRAAAGFVTGVAAFGVAAFGVAAFDSGATGSLAARLPARARRRGAGEAAAFGGIVEAGFYCRQATGRKVDVLRHNLRVLQVQYAGISDLVRGHQGQSGWSLLERIGIGGRAI